MRMPPLHLRDERLRDVVQRERAALLRDHRVKENLQQQIAELFTQSRVVLGEQRLVHLVCLFDEVRAERLVGLRRIPIAALSQVAHQRERIF